MRISFNFIAFGLAASFLGSFYLSGWVWIIYSFVLLWRAVWAVKDFPIDMHIAYLFSLFFISVCNMEIYRLLSNGILLSSFQYARPELFQEADLIWGLGSAFILLGIAIPVKKRPKLVIYWELPSSKFNLFFILGFAMIFKDNWLPVQLPGTFDNILSIFPLAATFFLTFNGVMHENSRWQWYGFIICMVFLIKAALYSYLRLDIILPALVFILAQFLGTRSFKFLVNKFMLPIYGVLVLFFIFFEAFGGLRSNAAVGFNRFSDLQQGREQMKTMTRDEEEQLNPFQRSSVVNQISACAGLVEDRGLYLGKASAPLAAALIPRALWPEKPKIALGAWFAVEIGAGVQTETWFNNSINMTIPGQLYLDFGWAGVALGCVLVGMLLNWLWQHSGFYVSSFNLFGVFFGVFMLYNIVFGLGADLQMFITMIAMYLIFLMLSKLIPRFNEFIMRRSAMERQ
jgi:hypothetical protein